MPFSKGATRISLIAVVDFWCAYDDG